MNDVKYISISLLFLLINQTGHARKITNKQFALFNYEVNIDKAFREEISALEPQINSIRSYTNKKQDKLEGKIYDIAYGYIEEKLEKKYEITILPVNSFTTNIKYNPYNYPAASIKKAQDLGDSHYYIKITISIDTKIPKQKDAKNSILYRDKTLPVVKIDIELYDKVGMLPVGKATGIGEASKPQTVEASFLKGIISTVSEEKIPELNDNLMGLLYTAIQEVVIKFEKI